MKATANFLVNAKAESKASIALPTQTNTLLQEGNGYTAETSILESFMDNNYAHSSIVKLIIWVLFHTGCRISEVLTAKIIYDGYLLNIFIVGSKGSNSRVKSIISHKNLDLPMNENLHNLVRDYSRFYIYRVCKTSGLYLDIKGNSNKSVTHSFRHLYIARLRSVNDEINTTASEIGHKNSNNTLRYGNQ